MSNTSFKKSTGKKWQKGVALLFALGILGLLLVMALGFATNSIFDQLIANNTGNSSAAKTIASSGLERVRNMIQNYSDKMSISGASYDFKALGILAYSHSEDPTVYNNAVANSDLLSNASFFGGYTTWDPVKMTNNINWIYLKSDNQIVGRMAYIILNRADLDPAKLVSNSVDESQSPAIETRLGANTSEINLRSINNELADIVKISQPVAQNFNYSSYVAAPGKYNGNNWIDLNFLFDQFVLNDVTDTDNPSLRTRFSRWFICNSQNSPEAFWIDKNSDVKITVDEQFHRFKLNSLATMSVTTINKLVALYDPNIVSANPYIPNVDITQPPPNGSLWTDSTFIGMGIPWIATFGMKDSGVAPVQIPAVTGPAYPVWVDDDANPAMTGSFPNVRTRRAQIAANIADYCNPAASAVTADVSPANWGTTNPTFTGNKKTPYLNELGIQIGAYATRSVIGASANTKVNVTVTVDASCELIDIYGLAAYNDSTISVYYDLSFTFAGSSVGPPADVNLTNQIGTITIPAAQWPGAGARYAVPVGWVNLYTNISPDYTVPDVDTVNFDINNLVLTVKKVILNYNGQNVDFSNLATIGSSTKWPAKQQLTYASNVNGIVTADSFMGFQANDPRQNLNPGDWTKLEAVVSLGAVLRPYSDYNGTATGTLGSRNLLPAAVDPSAVAGCDTELATDPAYVSAADTGHLSTAFIREAQMVSPWELGFIHRGKAWETLNLHKYDATKAAKAIAFDIGGGTYKIFSAGGGLYADGDANVLNQIKMNDSSKNYKIDLNNQYQDITLGRRIVLYSLFKNIKVGSAMSIVAPGITAGTDIPDADIGTIADNIVYRTGTGGAGTIYLTRAQAVNDMIAGASPIPGYGTKAKQDEIIGKMMNLADLDSYYTVILIAQTIKDVGTAGGIDIIKKDSNGTYNFTGANQAKLGIFDCMDTGATNVKGEKIYAYADEIKSTVKVQALIHKKTDGSCEIIGVKYIQ